jgi:hypothetical protein
MSDAGDTNSCGWNYRLIHIYGKDFRNNSYEYWEVHEVYYDKEDRPASMTERFTAPGGETVGELLASWRAYQTALAKPALIWDDATKTFVGEEKPIL